MISILSLDLIPVCAVLSQISYINLWKIKHMAADKIQPKPTILI